MSTELDNFKKGINTTSEHMKHIYEDSELDEKVTVRKFRIVQTEGTRQVSRLVKTKSSVYTLH